MPSNYCDNQYCGHQAAAHDGDRGDCTEDVTDLYGTWKCLCVGFERDPDE